MGNALVRFDRTLLDRFFQPIASLLSGLARPPALAESCLFGSAVMTLGEVAVDLRSEGLNLSTIFFGALNLAAAVWLVGWYRSHGGLSGKTANPFREMPLWVSLRLSAVANLAISVLVPVIGIRSIGAGAVSVPLMTTHLATAFDIAAAFLCVCGLYFAACSMPPAKVRAPSGGKFAGSAV